MTELVLYGVAVSAFVAKVRVVLDHKAMTYTEKVPPGGYGSPAYRQIVPAGSVPALTVDGQPLHDSNAIIEFLDDLEPTPPLRPTDPMTRAQMRALLGFHDTRVEAAARTLFPVIKGNGDADAGIEAINAALLRLDEIVAPLMAGRFIFGSMPTLADLVFPCTIQMAELMAAELGKSLNVPPRVDQWRKEVAKIDAVARSLTIAGDAMGTWMSGFRAG